MVDKNQTTDLSVNELLTNMARVAVLNNILYFRLLFLYNNNLIDETIPQELIEKCEKKPIINFLMKEVPLREVMTLPGNSVSAVSDTLKYKGQYENKMDDNFLLTSAMNICFIQYYRVNGLDNLAVYAQNSNNAVGLLRLKVANTNVDVIRAQDMKFSKDIDELLNIIIYGEKNAKEMKEEEKTPISKITEPEVKTAPAEKA